MLVFITAKRQSAQLKTQSYTGGAVSDTDGREIAFIRLIPFAAGKVLPLCIGW